MANGISQYRLRTRFKFYDNDGARCPTPCPLFRGAPDSLDHLLTCVGLEMVPRKGEGLVESFRTIDIRSFKGNLGRPILIFLGTAGRPELSEATLFVGEISLSP